MNETPEEKARIIEATLLILVSWAFWFGMGYAIASTMAVVGR